jgi:hypothetical protein
VDSWWLGTWARRGGQSADSWWSTDLVAGEVAVVDYRQLVADGLGRGELAAMDSRRSVDSWWLLDSWWSADLEFCRKNVWVTLLQFFCMGKNVWVCM